MPRGSAHRGITMSSSDRDALAADYDNVSRMSDPTKDENLYYKRNSLWGCRDVTDVDDHQLCCRRSFLLFPGIFALFYICTCTNCYCWSMGIGAEYALFLHRNHATINHLRDHCVSSTCHCECGLATGGSCAYSFCQILRSTD